MKMAEIVALVCSRAVSSIIRTFDDVDGSHLAVDGLICSCLCWKRKPKPKKYLSQWEENLHFVLAWHTWNIN